MKNERGEGVDQRELLSQLEITLNKTAVDTCKVIGCSYNTYKEWKGGRKNMLSYTLQQIKMIKALIGTPAGKLFGI